MRINIRALGLASGVIAAATFVVCGLLVAVAPSATMSAFGWVLHVDLSGIARPIYVSNFIGGLIMFSAFVGICIAAVGWLYNRFAGSSQYSPA
jgi:hypothetical protein